MEKNEKAKRNLKLVRVTRTIARDLAEVVAKKEELAVAEAELRAELKDKMKAGDVYEIPEFGKIVLCQTTSKTVTDENILMELGVYDKVLSSEPYVDVNKVKLIAETDPKLKEKLTEDNEIIYVRKMKAERSKSITPP
jgi:hypothetical protein